MVRNLIIGGIVVFWLTMMTLLVKREVLPAWATPRVPTYRAVVAQSDLPRRTQMGLYLAGQRLGTSRSVTRRDTEGNLLIEGELRAEATVPVLLFRTAVTVTSAICVGADGRLKWFRIDALAPGIERTMRGEVDGDELVITTDLGPRQETRRIAIDPREVLMQEVAPFEGLGNLRVGQRWVLQQLNPLTGRYVLVPVEVRAQEPITLGGQEVDAFLLVSRVDRMELRAWLRPDGEIIRQQLPFGVVLESEPYSAPTARPRRPLRTEESP